MAEVATEVDPSEPVVVMSSVEYDVIVANPDGDEDDDEVDVALVVVDADDEVVVELVESEVAVVEVVLGVVVVDCVVGAAVVAVEGAAVTQTEFVAPGTVDVRTIVVGMKLVRTWFCPA